MSMDEGLGFSLDEANSASHVRTDDGGTVQEALDVVTDGTFNVESYNPVGGGADDQAAVQAAADAADDAGGGIVKVTEAYALGSAVELGDNTILEMSGNGRLYRRSIFNDALVTNKGRDGTGYTGNSNVGVRGGAVDDRRDELGASELPQACIAFGHCDGVVVEGVSADQCYFHGIEINSSKNFRVQFNTVTNSRSSSIQLDNASGGGFAGLNSDDTIVQQGDVSFNYCRDQDDVGEAVMDRAGAVHVHKMPAKHINIHHNVLENCANGVTCDNATGSSTTLVNEDINIHDNLMVGIVKDATETRTLNGYGVYCVPTKGLSIHDNKIWGIQRRAIRVLGSGSLRNSDVSIKDNIIEMDTGEHGIDVSKIDGWEITGNNIRGTWKATGTWGAITCGEDVTDGHVFRNEGDGGGATNVTGLNIVSPSNLDATHVEAWFNTMKNFKTNFKADDGSGTFTDIDVMYNTSLTPVTTAYDCTNITSGRFFGNKSDGVVVFAASKTFKVTRTAGNLTLNSTTWADMPGATTWEGVLKVQAGDLIQVGLNARQSSEGTYSFLDVGTIVSAAVVNTLSGVAEGASNEGITNWSGITGVASNVGGAVIYTVQAGDIVNGAVTLRLRYRTLAATNKTFLSDSTRPATFWGRVLSQ